MFATIPSVIQHIQAGKLRALAVTSAQRSRSLPDVPTVAEKGFPGFAAGSWFGFFAPKGTPEPVIALAQQGRQRDPAVARGADGARGRRSRSAAAPRSSAQFTQKEYEKWKVIVRDSGATPE